MPVTTFGNLTKKMYDVIERQDNTLDVLNLFERWTLDAIGIAGFGKVNYSLSVTPLDLRLF
jgi:hypothetical protein